MLRLTVDLKTPRDISSALKALSPQLDLETLCTILTPDRGLACCNHANSSGPFIQSGQCIADLVHMISTALLCADGAA